MATSQGLSSNVGPREERQLQPAPSVQAVASTSTIIGHAQAARTFFIERLRFPLVVFALSFSIFLTARTYARASGKAALLVWDAVWYGTIIDRGYWTDGNTSVMHNVVFLPLYPLVCRAVKHLLSIATPDAMLLVSALSTMVMLALVYNLLAPLYSAFVVRMTTLFLAFGPFSVFLYSGYSEALFLSLLALFFVLLLRKQYWAAGIVTGIASACRPYAPLLVIVLILEAARQYYSANGLRLKVSSSLLLQLLVAIPLSFTGLAAYTMWSYYRFDDPLAFAHGYLAWSSHHALPTGMADLIGFHYIMDAMGSYAFASGITSPLVIGLILFASGPVLMFCLRKELFPSALAFMVLMFLLCHFNIVNDRVEITNLGRHFSLFFPFSLLLALAVDPGRIRMALLRASAADRTPAADCGCLRAFSLCPALVLLVASAILNMQYVVMFYRAIYVS